MILSGAEIRFSITAAFGLLLAINELHPAGIGKSRHKVVNLL